RRRHTRFSRDWSSDVCSSDLAASGAETVAAISRTKTSLRAENVRCFCPLAGGETGILVGKRFPPMQQERNLLQQRHHDRRARQEIGRASCRERGWASAVAVGL